MPWRTAGALGDSPAWSAYTYPRTSGVESAIPVYSNDGLSRNYGTAAAPRYPEAAYGFMRFRADVGPTSVVGLDRLNPQLQDRVVANSITPPQRSNPKTYATGTLARKGATNRSARPYEK